MASYERYKEYATLTAAELAAVNNIFPEGQLVVEADTGKMKVGDGVTAYNSLPFAPSEISSLTLTGGTATTNTPVLSATQTWNNAAVTFTGWRLNITDTASNADSLLMDLQVGGTSRLSLRKDGRLIFGTFNQSSTLIQLGQFDGYGIASDANGAVVFMQNNLARSSANGWFIKVGNSGAFQWSATDLVTGATDLALFRDAANTLAQRNGVNAQTFRLYSTYTDGSNYARARFEWAANNFEIGTEAAGTGLKRPIGIGGSGINFRPLSGSTSAVWQMTSAGHLLAVTDNTYDIGASGADRPRNLFLAGNITTGGGLTLAAAGYLVWPGRGSFDAAAVDIVRLSGATVGAALQMSEMTAPAAPAANEVRIYAEDNGSGKTRLMARFATGAAQQIAIEP